MATKSNRFKTPSRTSPKNGARGCLCDDNTYSVKCCDGSMIAQGIGVIYRIETYYLTSNKALNLTTQKDDNLVYGK